MDVNKHFDQGYFYEAVKGTLAIDINEPSTKSNITDNTEVTTKPNVADNNEATKPNVIDSSEVPRPNVLVGNGTEKKTDWMKRIVQKNVETGMDTVNKEQERVIEKLKKVLNFLESVQVKNEESLSNINKPLDDLLSSLKYLPISPSYNILPIEIKTLILSYLCDSGAFVAASVCREWSDILRGRLSGLIEVSVGKCCSNSWACQDFACFMPEETLKASTILRMDIPLSICYPVQDVDSKLLAEGLTSVSDFAINNECYCREFEDDDDCDADMPLMTKEQIKDLIEALDKKTDTITNVYLEGLNMTHLDQDMLINCLLKVKHVRLVQGHFPYDEADEPMLNVETLIRKLLQDSIDLRLNHLDLEYMEYPEELSVDLADALCRVEGIDLGPFFPLTPASTNRLIDNILTRPIKTKTLFIMKKLNWRDLISSEDLKILINNVSRLELRGNFSSKQVKVARSIPRVTVRKQFDEKNVFSLVKISKEHWAP